MCECCEEIRLCTEICSLNARYCRCTRTAALSLVVLQCFRGVKGGALHARPGDTSLSLADPLRFLVIPFKQYSTE